MNDTKATSWLTGRQVGSAKWESIPLLTPDGGTDIYGAIIVGAFLVGQKQPSDDGKLWDEIKILDAAGQHIGGHFRRSQQLTLGF